MNNGRDVFLLEPVNDGDKLPSKIIFSDNEVVAREGAWSDSAKVTPSGARISPMKDSPYMDEKGVTCTKLIRNKDYKVIDELDNHLRVVLVRNDEEYNLTLDYPCDL